MTNYIFLLFFVWKKADLYAVTHPDWAPSLKYRGAESTPQGTGTLNNSALHHRTINRHETKKRRTAVAALLDLQNYQDPGPVSETSVKPVGFVFLRKGHLRAMVDPQPQAQSVTSVKQSDMLGKLV